MNNGKWDNKIKWTPDQLAAAKEKVIAGVKKEWQPDNKADPKEVLKMKGKDYYKKWSKKNKK
jgi:hypothetical protein